MKKNYVLEAVIFVALILLLALFNACGGQQSHQEESAVQQKDLPIDIPKLEKRYKIILCHKFDSTPEIKSEYSKEIGEMQNSMIESLKKKNEFERVDIFDSGQEIGNDTLIIKADVTYMRIVGFWKRGYVLWERSWIDVNLKFVDGKTKNLLRENKVTSANNPIGAYFAWGNTDKSLPSDMGKILAEYIALSMPQK